MALLSADERPGSLDRVLASRKNAHPPQPSAAYSHVRCKASVPRLTPRSDVASPAPASRVRNGKLRLTQIRQQEARAPTALWLPPPALIRRPGRSTCKSGLVTWPQTQLTTYPHATSSSYMGYCEFVPRHQAPASHRRDHQARMTPGRGKRPQCSRRDGRAAFGPTRPSRPRALWTRFRATRAESDWDVASRYVLVDAAAYSAASGQVGYAAKCFELRSRASWTWWIRQVRRHQRVGERPGLSQPLPPRCRDGVDSPHLPA